MKIYAPVKDFNGLRNNVRFVNGVGETDDQTAIEWFSSRGYTTEKYDNSLRIEHEKLEIHHGNSLEKVIKPSETSENTDFTKIQTKKVVEVDFDAMTPNELRDWMKENGFGSKIKNIRNKEKLLEIIRG